MYNYFLLYTSNTNKICNAYCKVNFKNHLKHN